MPNCLPSPPPPPVPPPLRPCSLRAACYITHYPFCPFQLSFVCILFFLVSCWSLSCPRFSLFLFLSYYYSTCPISIFLSWFPLSSYLISFTPELLFTFYPFLHSYYSLSNLLMPIPFFLNILHLLILSSSPPLSSFFLVFCLLLQSISLPESQNTCTLCRFW